MTRFLERATSAWAIAGGIVLITIMLVTSVNVGAFALDRIARLAGTNVAALPGYEDFVRLAVGVAALMFLPYCQARSGHVTVDLFVSHMPARVRTVLDGCWSALMTALATFLLWQMSLGALETWRDGARSPVLGWLEWPFYLPGVASLALWALISATQTLGAWRRG